MQEIENLEFAQERMKELYEQKAILRIRLPDVDVYSYPSSQYLANVLQRKSIRLIKVSKL